MVYYTFKVNLEVNQMGKKIINLGLDIGNYDVKTVNTSTPSGFNVFTKCRRKAPCFSNGDIRQLLFC